MDIQGHCKYDYDAIRALAHVSFLRKEDPEYV